MTIIPVATSDPYDVVLTNGDLHERVLGSLDGVAKVLIVHTGTLGRVAEQLRQALSESVEVLLAEVPDAESAKRVEVAAFCWGVMGKSDFTRSDAVIGLGGGAVTDLAGFVAATWLRGVRLIQIPTSVLGIVDAAVGGKTGINTAEGKNLVGSFYHPFTVIADVALLETLPRNELLTGFAEIVKCGFIADERILEIIESDVAAATQVGSPEFLECLERAIRVKALVVAEDFHDHGAREFLNYGHTLGHAIELAERYQWRHGAAVSIGMVFAAELSRLGGRLDDASVERHRTILDSLQLPTTYPARKWQQLLASMRRDKKARGAHMRFIVLDDIAKPRVMEGPDESLLFAAFHELQQGVEEPGTE
ncbi:3-dehydroquinate synthase [Humidisolicoccus flavus]|uniref:3-dehydroquinate synthase n=1 Tax=Humidisolicoccus flavus TaxID=3111414 RepID=UPI003243D47C